jgi:hypothetical protein
MNGTKNTTNLRISDLKKDHQSGILNSNPDYQRYNNAWGPQQKGSLIVSILQNYPIGEIIRCKVSNDGITEKYEIVDGLQRLTAITDFMNDEVSLNPDDSNKIIKTYLAHFDIENTELNKIIKKYEIGKSIRMKFKNLPESLRNKIQNAEVSVATLSNWEEKDVIEYFRRVQEGKPLTNADKLHTVQTELTSNIKSLSSNKNILSCLGLRQENGKNKKSADRIVYQTALESIYCKLGQTVGQPSKLDKFFKEKEHTPEQTQYFNIISGFLNSLTDNDKYLFKSNSLKTDLKLIFCLLLFGDKTFKNYDEKEYNKFVINVSVVTGYLKSWKDNPNKNEHRNTFTNKINEIGLSDIYENNKEWFDNFQRLRWSSHPMDKVQTICEKISSLYKQTLLQTV